MIAAFPINLSVPKHQVNCGAFYSMVPFFGDTCLIFSVYRVHCIVYAVSLKGLKGTVEREANLSEG